LGALPHVFEPPLVLFLSLGATSGESKTPPPPALPLCCCVDDFHTKDLNLFHMSKVIALKVFLFAPLAF